MGVHIGITWLIKLGEWGGERGKFDHGCYEI